MKIRTAIRAGAAAVLLTLTVGVLAFRADAHIPNAKPSCTGLTVTATDYPAGSWVTVLIDGATKVNQSFGPSFSALYPWSQTEAHAWAVTITTAPGDNFPTYSPGGTWQACQDVTTTVPTPTTTTVPCPGPVDIETGACAPPTTTTVPPTSPPTTVAPVHLTGTLTGPPCGSGTVTGTVTNPNPYDAGVQIFWPESSAPIQFAVPAGTTKTIAFGQGLDVTRTYDMHGSLHLADGSNVKAYVDGGPWTITTVSGCTTPVTPPGTQVPPDVEGSPAPPAGTPIDMSRPAPAAPECRDVSTVTPENPLGAGETLCQTLPVTGFPAVLAALIGLGLSLAGISLWIGSKIRRRPEAV